MASSLSEKIIEDILSSDKSILAELLSLDPGSLSLIARQKILASGRLDLLCLYENELLVIELKTVGFYEAIIGQLNAYSEDLRQLQNEHRIIDVGIRKIALVTNHRLADAEKCQAEKIQIVSYRPEHVLSKYYENFKELSAFLKIQSGDYGVVRLGLLKTTLHLLSEGRSLREISEAEGKSDKTIRNRLSVACLLDLAARFKGEYFLTDFGGAFCEADDAKLVDDRLSDAQVELLSGFVRDNPFHSSITYTIFAIVEAVFVLAKNAYPVPKLAVIDYFVASVGKNQTWKTEKARETATYIFSNYACELQLLAQVDKDFYLTPKGVQAILLLQLNRSIKLIEAQKIG